MTEVIDRPLGREEALRRLRALEPELRARGVERLFLFGSVGRDQATSESDLDVFFDLEDGRPMGVFEYIGLKHWASDVLGIRTDLILRDGLHRLIRQEVQAEAVRVF